MTHDPKSTSEVVFTHKISGWFVGAHNGEDEGNLYQIHEPTDAQRLGTGVFVTIERFTEILTDGREREGSDLLYLEPAWDMPHTIVPI